VAVKVVTTIKLLKMVDQVAEAERILVLQKLEMELQVKEITAVLVFNQEELVVAEVHLK
jgi:hypothetical protein